MHRDNTKRVRRLDYVFTQITDMAKSSVSDAILRHPHALGDALAPIYRAAYRLMIVLVASQ
jgi:hypothetical protein